MLLKHFQLAGHKPLALVVVQQEWLVIRQENRMKEIYWTNDLRHNQEAIKDNWLVFWFYSNSANAAELVNNYDWMKNFSFLDFIRDVETLQ
jgi:tyrosyl-tRNA synthetase